VKIGVVGGGQLGRMLGLAGLPLGFHFRFIEPAADCPAARLGEIIRAPYDDLDALERFAQDLSFATYEFENVPAETAQWLSERLMLAPTARALAIAQYQSKTSSAFHQRTKSTPLCAKFLFLPFSKPDDLGMTVKVNAFCEQMAMMLQQRCELHGTNLAECHAFSSLSWIFLQRSP
jgi:hypothetical protein